MNGASMEVLGYVMAAISAAALVCGLFYPMLLGASPLARRSAFFAALRKVEPHDNGAANRNIRRAQEFALKAIAETNRARKTTRLGARMEAAGFKWPQGRFWAGCMALGCVIFAAAVLSRLSVATALAGATLGAWLILLRGLAFLAERRRKKFLAGFAAAVDMIVRGAKSGLSVADCLNVVAADAAPSVRKEFSVVAAQLRAGVSVAEAMAKLGASMPTVEVRFFALVMAMQSQTGGNLSEALGNLAKVLRDRQRLAAKIRVASAEVRASAIAVGSLPFVVAGATSIFSPDYIALLWTDESGRRVVIICLGWLVLGIAVLRRMARIEV